MAMGWESDFSLPEEINWSDVLELSSEQGVAAIVMDGYEVFLKNNPGATSFLRIPENKSLKVYALGKITNTENSFHNHCSALQVLADKLNKKCIPFLILKGFSCARYYPIPSHRGCSDIDIYPGYLFKESNEALADAGMIVDPHYYRHHVLAINGVTVENHRVLCDLRGPYRQTHDLESQLEKLANDSIKKALPVSIQGNNIPSARFPSASFNALFLPWHVSAHFEFERVTIRHLLDWALFLIQDGKDIDVERFREAKRQYTFGFSKFADILTNLSIRYLRIPTDSLPALIVEDAMRFDNGLADKILNYMFVGKPRVRDKNVWIFRLNNVKRIWKERWKYHDVYDMSVLRLLFHKVYGVLLKVGKD